MFLHIILLLSNKVKYLTNQVGYFITYFQNSKKDLKIALQIN